jgi:ribosomal subunit interface protein
MQVNVTGKQIDIGGSLRSHVETNLESVVMKYFDRPGQANVIFSREGSSFKCDCSVHLDSGILLQSSGQNDEIYASFEEAAEHMDKRVRRYKRRLKNHHNDSKAFEVTSSQAYVISTEDKEEEPETLQPIIIAETRTDIRTCSVGEAVMQMDLADSPTLVFRNAQHGGVNVVYRREDGNIGWVDPGSE